MAMTREICESMGAGSFDVHHWEDGVNDSLSFCKRCKVTQGYYEWSKEYPFHRQGFEVKKQLSTEKKKWWQFWK